MSIARRLVGLYPDPFRERWGLALEVEAESAGWRSWPNLVAGIVDMWLHPAVWPAESRAQRRRRAASMSITIAVTGWFLSHVAAEMGTPLPAHSARGDALTVCTVMLLVGLVLVAPRPRLTLDTVTALTGRTIRRLTAPAALGAGVVAVVHFHENPDMPTAVRLGVLLCWWVSIASGAAQICAIAASLDATLVVAPHPLRLRLGIWVLTASTVIGGSVFLGISATGARLDRWSAVCGPGMLLLAWLFVATLRDLRRVPATDTTVVEA